MIRDGKAASVSAALEIDDVAVDIAGRRIVEGISISAHGEVVGLVGPNGSGKSTILRTVYRMLRPATGSVHAAGNDVWATSARNAARVLAAVVQDAPSDLELTVAECVATGRVAHGTMLGGDRPEDAEAVEQAMTLAGVVKLAHRDMSSLSGGERQRVQLARALAQKPSVLVLDEPTNHLDIRHQLELLALVRDLDITTVVTLHDLNLAASYCDRIVVLSRGAIVATGAPRDVFTPQLLQRVFGVTAAIITNPLTNRPQLVYTHRSTP
ncbi:MAG: ABC transporter ATP-binding protein [Candidatus Microbacterium stercoravium]|uniref:ABC transporter (Iron.B12.siderophore.hemin), ATP-binding component n=2 Tax=Mycetocola reblochoni TaxID=331618 RepID=A0A1R4JJK8_9MICO|nr:ABC transporter ATP-binding protein [Mycetocola reblochoni]RLP67668.1 ABC transporter ATP-binding protein [Mycetocola reblochoni]SJN32216.1 ABC transporter (iron.B12.siderophore.hemin), ATP-binding component [Mycetocola reblochoni REB411]